MALLFSSVSVTDGMYETEFLVGGIPRELEDLEGWTAFDDLTEDISEETDISMAEMWSVTMIRQWSIFALPRIMEMSMRHSY